MYQAVKVAPGMSCSSWGCCSGGHRVDNDPQLKSGISTFCGHCQVAQNWYQKVTQLQTVILAWDWWFLPSRAVPVTQSSDGFSPHGPTRSRGALGMLSFKSPANQCPACVHCC